MTSPFQKVIDYIDEYGLGRGTVSDLDDERISCAGGYLCEALGYSKYSLYESATTDDLAEIFRFINQFLVDRGYFSQERIDELVSDYGLVEGEEILEAPLVHFNDKAKSTNEVVDLFAKLDEASRDANLSFSPKE